MWRDLGRLDLILGAAAMALSLLACSGGKGKGSFDGSTYRNGTIAFQVPPQPTDWKRIEEEDAILAFRDSGHGASVIVNARCLSADDRTPLVALTNHLLIGATERVYITQEVEPFDGREALHTKLKAKWDGVPMGLDVFVLSKDGCIYDFIYIGAPSAFEQGAATFERFVRGFRTLRGSGVVG
jgi:hypothetical protein